ncbi:hypothetical protein V6N13_116621 [Hibiscus sabdariffa]|uniref:Uncharacterized protein n=1 Tax=Hibiscus sabdariffa TaxID=183260 RepID=A0ABR2QGY0_9ROSI
MAAGTTGEVIGVVAMFFSSVPRSVATCRDSVFLASSLIGDVVVELVSNYWIDAGFGRSLDDTSFGI